MTAPGSPSPSWPTETDSPPGQAPCTPWWERAWAEEAALVRAAEDDALWAAEDMASPQPPTELEDEDRMMDNGDLGVPWEFWQTTDDPGYDTEEVPCEFWLTTGARESLTPPGDDDPGRQRMARGDSMSLGWRLFLGWMVLTRVVAAESMPPHFLHWTMPLLDTALAGQKAAQDALAAAVARRGGTTDGAPDDSDDVRLELQ